MEVVAAIVIDRAHPRDAAVLALLEGYMCGEEANRITPGERVDRIVPQVRMRSLSIVRDLHPGDCLDLASYRAV